MTEASILRIMRRGHAYQVRYASSNPYDIGRRPYLCPDEGAMITLLHHSGLDAWSLQQAMAVLRKGGMAVLPLALSEAQRQAYFPLADGSKACLSLVRGAGADGL
jgi:hypothetical protein